MFQSSPGKWYDPLEMLLMGFAVGHALLEIFTCILIIAGMTSASNALYRFHEFVM